jgi:proteasome assembly chaperone (PAC2) family protein
MGWEITELKKAPKIKDAILVEGLPGIGNVGKIAVDFIVEQLKPVEVYDFYSHALPHSVFVNKDSLVELPKIRMLILKRTRKPDLVFLVGDVQPVDEVSSHEFSEAVLNISEKLGVRAIITTGGIGMSHLAKDPKVYMTGNTKKAVDEFFDKGVRRRLVGVVGPIVGVTGLLLGLAEKRKIPAVAYLVESFAHPLHIGVKEAGVLLALLDKKLKLGLKMDKFEKSIEELGQAVRLKTAELKPMRKETSYIG